MIKGADRLQQPSLSFDVSGGGPPLILLHGMSGSRHWWGRNVPVLAERFRTYTVDLPGFGDSRRIRWNRFDGTVDLLHAWMSAEGIDRADIIGHSLGGAIAARLAARCPARVNRLVLVDAAIRVPGSRISVRAADLRHVFRRTPAGFTPLLARDILRSHPLSFVAAGADVLLTDWHPQLAAIAAPTLVVWGEHDLITPLAFGSRIAAALPDARLRLIPEAGHTPMWEQPELFNAAVLAFLGEQRPEVP